MVQSAFVMEILQVPYSSLPPPSPPPPSPPPTLPQMVGQERVAVLTAVTAVSIARIGQRLPLPVIIT